MAKGFPLFNLTISKSSNALYVYTAPPGTVLQTDAINNSTLVDLGEGGKVIGVEFLGINRRRVDVDAIIEKYATHDPDTLLPAEGAYFLRFISLIEWNLI